MAHGVVELEDGSFSQGVAVSLVPVPDAALQSGNWAAMSDAATDVFVPGVKGHQLDADGRRLGLPRGCLLSGNLDRSRMRLRPPWLMHTLGCRFGLMAVQRLTRAAAAMMVWTRGEQRAYRSRGGFGVLAVR